MHGSIKKFMECATGRKRNASDKQPKRRLDGPRELKPRAGEKVVILKHGTKEVKVQLVSGAINKETLRSAFLLEDDVPVALYKDDIMLTCINNVFNLGKMWKGQTYIVEWKEERRLRPSTRMGEAHSSAVNTSIDQSKEQNERIERYKKWMYYSILLKTEDGTFENASSIRSCVTVATKDIALMAAHCLPIGVPEGFTFEIYSQEGRPHMVQVKYINRNVDFVVLKTMNEEFDTCPIGLEAAVRGIEYTVLGYNNYNYQVSDSLSSFFGRIGKFGPDYNFVIGSPGTSRGCSGAGAFAYSRLIGIVISGRIYPRNVCSSTGSLADNVTETDTERAEPSYSHIVQSSTIFALFNKHVGYKL
ncbi:hypothetical protein M3Y94_00339100 [Aphelenchoides besseyi]|nr:hypothetical protein M3Y94_00339100 [Aphelenchoides besseyi]KAI6235463.1 hypothetical protein M3Y95_00054200 [Aphelenchoides besseyi]